MAYAITDACISCGACTDACPMGLIKQGDEHYEIDANQCIDCGACADSCPTQAIVQQYLCIPKRACAARCRPVSLSMSR